MNGSVALWKMDLIVAVNTGDLTEVRRLLQIPGMDINAGAYGGGNQDVLITAVKNGSPEIVKALLNNPEIQVNNTNKNKNTALIFAAQKGYTEIVEELLKHPEIQVNNTNIDGDTALMWAAQTGYTEIVRLLLNFPGINVNRENNKTDNALIFAANKGYTEIVRLLLAHPEININHRTKYGGTAIMWAAINGNTKMVRLLLARPEIQVNHAERRGMTSLMWAANKGYIEIVKLLLDFPGINVNLKNNEGKTAFMLAINDEISNLLEHFSPKNTTNIAKRLNASHRAVEETARANGTLLKKGMNNARRRVELNRLNATRSLPRNNRTNIMSNSTRRLFNARNARSAAEANAIGRSSFPWNNARIPSAIPTAPVYRPPPPQLVKCPKCSSQIQPPPGAPIYACGSCGQHMRSPY
jgi:ankyrin repeat protein